MGAAAITTTGFNLNRERMADLLGFKAPLENSYGCISSVDYVTGLYSALKVMFLNMGRFIQDLAQRSAFEVGHIYVPNEFVQISSIMPQKRNPVPIEHMRLIASLSSGHCDTIINTMHRRRIVQSRPRNRRHHGEARDRGRNHPRRLQPR